MRLFLLILLILIGAYHVYVLFGSIALWFVFFRIYDMRLYKKYYSIVGENNFPMIVHKLKKGKTSLLSNIETDINWPLPNDVYHKNNTQILEILVKRNIKSYKRKGFIKFKNKLLSIELKIENEHLRANKDDGYSEYIFDNFNDKNDIDLNESFRILGISPNSSLNEIKRAYKEKILRTHPDKVSHLSEELQKVAEEESIKINKAYQNIINKFK